MKKLRIFISSPGDVRQERMIAKKVISDLNKIYQDYVQLEPILWEDLPLEATSSFQGGIDYFLQKAPIDIAVFILWSRLGSALGSSFLRPDGTMYSSGTEYEFDMMYSLWQQTQKPKIMVYVKDTEPQYGAGLSTMDIRELLEQKDKLSHFIEEKFKDRETGTNYAYWQFDKQQTFEERLRVHLTRLIRDQIGDDVIVHEWDGNPYVGLKSYEMNESSIFCGRKDIVYDITGQILSKFDQGIKPTLFILGESGIGKSSLIKAGVLPQLLDETNKEDEFIVKIVTPSSFIGHVYEGIVNQILQLYPSLENNPVSADLRNGIPNDYDFKYLKYAIENCSSKATPIIFWDQFEEMFTDNLISDEDRQNSLRLLRGLCETKQIFLIFSMRNDFYNRFTSSPDLGVIKNISIIVDVPNISATDIVEIVEEPARKANLTWERNNKGISLSKRIIEDASKLLSLPLIEFALSELYEECKETKELTFKAYDKIGQLKGAIIQYANTFYSSLSNEEKEAINGILGSVITVSDDSERLFVRKTSILKNIEKTPIQKTVIQKLVDAHLFVTGKDANGDATVTFVHEILLTSWDVIREWINQHREFLQKNDHYEKLARYWKEKGCHKKDLIQERSVLLEAEYFMFQHENDLQTTTHEFIHQSLVKQQRKGIVRRAFLFLGALIVNISTLFVVLAGTTGIDSLDQELDIANWTTYDNCSTYLTWLALAILALYKLVISIQGKYKYKTIKNSVIFWTILVCYVTIDAFLAGIYNGFSWITWLLPCLFGLCGLLEGIEYWRRTLWKKNVFKPYIISDKIETAKNILLAFVISFAIIIVLAIYSNTITEQKEKLERALNVSDMLFNVCYTINFSWPDKKALIDKQKQLLIDNYKDELLDTIPDQREGHYATCLYHLYEPYSALSYLYPYHYWPDQCLYIVACEEVGLYSLTEKHLDEYVAARRWNDINWITHTNLIWTAEKLGRFDLADSIYSIVKEKGIAWDTNTADVINRGHIHLMKDDISNAISCYNYAKQVGLRIAPYMNENDINKIIHKNIANDFEIFNWLDIGDQTKIDEAVQLLNIHLRTFYTSVADSVTTEQMHYNLIGEWQLADSSLVISIHPKVFTCLYKYFDNTKGEKEEYYRTLSKCRFSKRNGHLYFEELNQHIEPSISISEIISLSDSTFSLRIIDNGNDSLKGIVRTYYKIKDSTL